MMRKLAENKGCPGEECKGRCRETFTCSTCGQRRNRCLSLVGGLDATVLECVRCYEVRNFGAEWVREVNAQLKHNACQDPKVA